MAKRKSASVVAVSAKLPDGSVIELAPPTEEQWDRYLEKLRRDQGTVGRRELVQTSCLSHKPDPNTGKISCLDRRPALIQALADGLDEYAGGGIDISTDEESGTVSAEAEGRSCTFVGPDIDSWESLQDAMGDARQKYGPTLRAFLYRHADDEPAARLLIAQKPAIIGPLVQAIGKIAGAGITVEVKKG